MITAPPLVLVVWEDATVLDAGPWADNSAHEYRPHIVHQVGYLLADTEQGVILTQAWHPSIIAARDQIPRGMIRSVTHLRPVSPVRKRGG